MNGVLMSQALTAVLMSVNVTPLTNLKDILCTIAGAVGAVLGVYGGIKFAMAFKNHDNQGEQAAIYTLVAAGVLIGLSAIIGLLTAGG